MDHSAFPSPFCYWGQTSDSITLLVDLKNVSVSGGLFTFFR